MGALSGIVNRDMTATAIAHANISSSLLDPQSCGEDLAYNAERFSALGPQFCSDCVDFHIRASLHRYIGARKILDQPELIRLARKIIADRAARSHGTIEVVIAGGIDTAMTAIAAHAAAVLGIEILNRCRFTLLDLCKTPLLVCEEFAKEHQLNFRGLQCDLTSVAQPCAADLIVTHSLLRFIPHADQAALLRRIGGWLAPQGRLILSNRVLLDDDGAEAKGEFRKRTLANKAIQAAIADGRLQLAESAEATLERLERAIGDNQGLPGEFRSLDHPRKVIRESGLTEISLEGLVRPLSIGLGETMQRRRVLAVLGPAG